MLHPERGEVVLKAALCAVLLVLAVEAHGQSGLRVLGGGLELTHDYGVLFGIPIGDGPFSVEGQVGPGGAGGSLSIAWPMTRRDSRDQGVSWFVNAGMGRYFTSADPGTPVGGVFTMIGGLRMVTNGAGYFHFARDGGLTLEAGLGIYQDVDRTVTGEKKRGTAGRLAVGWQF